MRRLLITLPALSLLWATAAFAADPAGTSGGTSDGAKAAAPADASPRPPMPALPAAPAGPQDESGAAQALPADTAPVSLSGTVSLKLSPTAHGPNVFVEDLVAEKLPPEVGLIAVKPAGGPGNPVSVDPALVALKLKRAPGGPYRLDYQPRAVRVEVPAQKVTGTLIKGFAREYLDEQLSGTAGVSVEQQGAVMDLVLYDAPLRFRVRPQDNQPLRGYVELRVEVLQTAPNGEEKTVDTVPVTYIVHRQEQRVFAAQPVRAGEPFTAQNLEVHDIDATFSGEGFTDPSMVEGKVARTFVPAGKALQLAMVDLPLSIRSGDMVRLMVRSGAVVVEASAKALRDARVGDSLPLQVTDTGRQVQARCVDTDVAVQDAW